MENVLRNCPFCNGKGKSAEIVFPNGTKGFRIYCANDECHVKPKTDTFNQFNSAIVAWNIRKGDSSKRIAELHARLEKKDRIIAEQLQNLDAKECIIHRQAIIISNLSED